MLSYGWEVFIMRLILPAILSALILGPGGTAASAEPYPMGPIRIVAPGPAGSPRDIRARWVAEKLGSALGRTMVVDNRPGAGGNVGMEFAAKSAPDGRTLVVVDVGTMAQNPHLFDRTGYDALRDFIPVIELVESPLMLAVPASFPIQSVADLVELSRQKPGQLSFGSSGIGTPPHLAGELFKRAANIDVVHVPYKGASPALLDLVAGRIAFTIDNPALQMPQVQAGKLRALAVTGARRIDIASMVPTLAEAGFPDYRYTPWMGVAVPAGTPLKLVKLLNAALASALREPDSQSWFRSQGGDIVADSPEAFAAKVRLEHQRLGEVIRLAGIRAE
jgi:tripartite-type tricarboxylate transporter receptor subunit TctC